MRKAIVEEYASFDRRFGYGPCGKIFSDAENLAKSIAGNGRVNVETVIAGRHP